MGILIPGKTLRRRRAMPLEDKMKNLEELEEDISNTDVGRFLSVPESTVCTSKN